MAATTLDRVAEAPAERRDEKGSGRFPRPALAALLLAFCALAWAYSAITPAFEAPDEPVHYAFVQSLLAGEGLPVQGRGGLLEQEFGQPPLYYLIEAPLATFTGGPANLPAWEHHNPFQNQTATGNANLYAHGRAEAFPWTGAVLGLHLMRAANVLFGVVTILATFGAARVLGLEPLPAWSAAAIVGLTPEFLFISGTLNSDNAIAATGALSLYLLLRWLRREPGWLDTIVLGLVTGLACLSKLSGLAALGLVIGFMALRGLSARKPVLFGHAAAALGCAALVSGWWYVRNAILYGDLLGWQMMLVSITNMLRTQPLNAWSAAGQLLAAHDSAWALFGWSNLSIAAVWYGLLNLVLAAAGLGLALRVNRAIRRWRLHSASRLAMEKGQHGSSSAASPGAMGKGQHGSLGLAAGFRLAAHRGLSSRDDWPDLAVPLLCCWPLAFFASLVRWVAVNTAAAQWRLLFPAFPALAILLVLGLTHLLGSRNRLVAVLPLGLLALSAGSLALVVPPAFAAPPAITTAIEHPLNVTFAGGLQLVGYSSPTPSVAHTGDTVVVDLFWRASRPLADDEAIDLVALNADGHLTFKQPTWPDEGRSATSTWQPGRIVRDRHAIVVGTSWQAGVKNLLVSVYHPVPPGTPLPAYDAAGRRLANDIVPLGRFLLLPDGSPAPTTRVGAQFEGNVQLEGYSLDQQPGGLHVRLSWQATGPVREDYTVFVHLSRAGRLVAQHDSQPDNLRFPTSLWPAGLRIDDEHVLGNGPLPAGSYTLELGLYELASGRRLPLAADPSQTSLVLPVTLAAPVSPN